MLNKEKGPGGVPAPRGPDHEGNVFMAEIRILRQGLRDEAKRTVLREAEARYRNELMDDEERMLLLVRIRRIRRQLRLV